jgi:hypothetical protein
MPILTLTKTLIGNFQGSDGLLRTRVSSNISYTLKENYENKSKVRDLTNGFEHCNRKKPTIASKYVNLL